MKLKPKDIRIGNYVANGGNAFQLRDAEDVTDLENFGCFYPLFLTEEWMRNLGFVETLEPIGPPINDALTVWTRDGHGFVVDVDGAWFIDGYHRNTARMRYVHQLQNLFFSLTGEELMLEEHVKNWTDGVHGGDNNTTQII